MNTLEWNQNYVVGIDSIDSEHRYFFRLINNVISAHNSSYPDDMIEQLLMGLWKYAESHFAAEELLMKASSYQDIHSHSNDHITILNELGKGIQDYRSKEKSLDDVIGVLIDWFYGHTISSDMKLGQHLKSQ